MMCTAMGSRLLSWPMGAGQIREGKTTRHGVDDPISLTGGLEVGVPLFGNA